MTFRPFELDPFDLLWRNLIDAKSHFSANTQEGTHPVSIYQKKDGIRFEVAAIGIHEDDISVLVDGDELRITYDRPDYAVQDTPIYKGIKKSSFNLTWKISTKFDLSKLEASLDKGLLHIAIPVAEGKAVKQIQISTPKALKAK